VPCSGFTIGWCVFFAESQRIHSPPILQTRLYLAFSETWWTYSGVNASLTTTIVAVVVLVEMLLQYNIAVRARA